jgi:hypothetical protein
MPDIVGRKFRVVPEFMRPKQEGKTEPVRPISGRVVWVHPKGRYALLEFDFGEPIRECFTLQELGLL